MINHLCLLNFCCCLHELKLTFCRGDKSVREKAFELFKAESPVEILVSLLHQRIQTQLSAQEWIMKYYYTVSSNVHTRIKGKYSPHLSWLLRCLATSSPLSVLR